jgi:hypothetical protein
MKVIAAFLLWLSCIQLNAYNNHELKKTNNLDTANTDAMKLRITVGSSVFTALLQNNTAAIAFSGMLPLALNMTELNGNEKYGELSSKLPANAYNPGTIEVGYLMLYGSNTLVIFYKSFSTSYSYTKLGRIDNPSGLTAALGSRKVRVTFEPE